MRVRAATVRERRLHKRRLLTRAARSVLRGKAALNPNISRAAVDEMLVQHLLTERLIRTIFDQDAFTKKNVIAAEVEKVVGALVSKSFSRAELLKKLDRFYVAIENAARTMPEFTDKQHFLNTVYERFFQGYSVKVADTHGIVYTPQPIVDFMCASLAEVLQSEFGKKLGDKGVNILDPCDKNRKYAVIDGRIKSTYARDSAATSVSKLNDPYVKCRSPIARVQVHLRSLGPAAPVEEVRDGLGLLAVRDCDECALDPVVDGKRSNFLKLPLEAVGDVGQAVELRRGMDRLEC